MGAISIENVSKRYRVYPRPSDRLRETLSFGKAKRHHDFWALKDVDLKIEPGVSLGLLGRNGAGKSTLLRIIAGVLQPSEGSVSVEGRIAALLQLGAGFNPEFTGRENAVLNGLFLGLDRGEMLERFDEIEEFADLGEFMDQPVKSYSSGMRARLGFAVAVNVEPEVLLVDETLSVGDGVFKHVGIQKMRELRESGATIVFVSHSTSMIKSFCDQAALLHKGDLIAHGDAAGTIDLYQALLSSVASGGDGLDILGTRPTAPELGEEEAAGEPGTPDFEEDVALQRRPSGVRHGTGEAKIRNVELLGVRGERTEFVSPESPFTVRVHVEYEEDVENSVVGIILRNKTGLDVFSTDSRAEGAPIKDRRAGDRTIVDFTFEAPLRHGPYSIAASVTPGAGKRPPLDWIDVAAALEIDRPNSRTKYKGMVHLPTQVKVFGPGGAQGKSGQNSEKSA